MKRLLVPVLLLTLAACNQGKQETSAGGEILEGSASDAMLPLDTVRSQAPLAPRAESTGKADEDAAAPGNAPTAAASAPAEAAPAETAADDEPAGE